MRVPFATDEALIEDAREGDRLAFETLIQPLISPAYRLALVMVRDPSQAEDCVQEAALRAWRRGRPPARARAGRRRRGGGAALVPRHRRQRVQELAARPLDSRAAPRPAAARDRVGAHRGPAGPVRGPAPGAACAAARRACRTAAPLRARPG